MSPFWPTRYRLIVVFGRVQSYRHLFAVCLDDIAKSCHIERNIFTVLCADDILVLAPSVCELDEFLKICERELIQLDMAINFNTSCCLRIGPRMNVHCLF